MVTKFTAPSKPRATIASQKHCANSVSSSGTTVRRNLFNAQLSRRNLSSASVATVNFVEAAFQEQEEENSEILVRNSDGHYAVKVPALPAEEDESQLEDDGKGRMAELLSNRTRHSSELELLEAVKAKLRRKVEALSEDQWQYSSESHRQ